MAPKKLESVKDGASNSGGPPRKLGEHGLALWRSVMAEYAIQDAGGVEMLCQARQALDRAEALREQIEIDGDVIRSKSMLKDHPGFTNWRTEALLFARFTGSASMLRLSNLSAAPAIHSELRAYSDGDEANANQARPANAHYGRGDRRL